MIDIFKIFRQYVEKRQKRKPKWRKIKYVLLKHIQTNIFDQFNDLHQVQKYKIFSHSFKFREKMRIIDEILEESTFEQLRK